MVWFVWFRAIPIVFLFTDQHVFKEAALIFLNDILSLGYPPGLFAEEDKDTIRNGVRNDAKTAGVFDSPDTLWEFFVNRVRALLHLCICMSPVGDKMRMMARDLGRTNSSRGGADYKCDDSFVHAFLVRHPELKLRSTSALDVTRAQSGPVSPYVWPVTHEGSASANMTSFPGRASKTDSIVCATPAQ